MTFAPLLALMFPQNNCPPNPKWLLLAPAVLLLCRGVIVMYGVWGESGTLDTEMDILPPLFPCVL